eukprot:TRINITY_DN1283_c0_g1_i1.p1 TRINITY_DN1283_c0_g1~~TRINITY_DN1283_c0_g1_i1.p1  ORF type:complete len:231 (+),score=44.25 TRINITY_DN1283_c0_g1_i1:97-693(+)
MAQGDVPGFDPTPYCIPGEIAMQEVMDMKRAFDMIDGDNTGKIDADELQGAAIAIGLPLEENIHVLLGTEKIDFANFFQRMTAKLTPRDTADDILSIFELFDDDRTGTISHENLVNIARIIRAKETPQQIQDILNTLDTDGDGELDPVDFYTCLVGGMRLRMSEEVKNQRANEEQFAQMQAQGPASAGASRASGLGTR